MTRTPRRQSRARSPESAPSVHPSAWLRRHRALVMWILIAAAALCRTVYFVELNATSLIEMQRWAQSDMNYYDRWARALAGGDWLSRTVGPPMHQWHREVADAYLNADPVRAESAKRDAAASGAPDVETFVWMRWTRTPTFYQDPLYPYLAGAVYRTIAEDPRALILVQMIFGVAAIVLVWLIALNLFGDAVALCAAALAVLSAPLLFYEGLLLRDSLVVIAGLAIAWLGMHVQATSARRAVRWAALLGVCCGVAWMLKSTFLVLLAVFVSATIVVFRDRPRIAGAVAAAILAGFLVPAVPLVIRNTAVGVPAVSLANVGPLTFLEANSLSSNPDAGWEVNPPHLAAFFGRTDGSLRAAVMTAVAEHTPADYARLLWRKWDRTWHWFEIPNNENIYYVRERVAILRYLPVGFWLISPLALVGLALGMSRFRLAWPLYAVVALASATLVAFLVVARQRAPLYAALLPFAALTISEIGRHCRDRRFARAIGLLAAVVAVSAWTGRPKSSDEYTIRTADWLLPFSLRDEGLADAAIQRNDWAAASAAYADFFSRDAPSPDQVALSDDPTLAPAMATMHLIRADFERRAGRAFDADVSEAETLLHLSTVRGSASSRDGRDQMRQAYWRLGDLYREANRPDRALDVYRALCNLSPDDTAARRRYAGALLRAERVPDAIEQYQQIVATSAEDKDAWSGLGIALADSRRFDEAVAAFREASRLDPRSGHAHYNLARALAATGALGDALAEAERAVALDPEDPALRSLVAELQRSGAKRLR